MKITRKEWVEISQRHYGNTKISDKKLYKTPASFHKVKDTIYANESINEHPWNRGQVYRVNNMATIKRVHSTKEDETTTEAHKENNLETTLPTTIKEDHKQKEENTISSGDLNIKADDKNGANMKTNKQEKLKSREDQIENVIKFLKVVTETISRNTQKSFGSKLRYLRSLHNSIMASIEERIESTWPDDTPASRSARSVSVVETRGHVDFPSSESALMTLSFLTFAVFLIKLVLQVIQTYKNKTMMMTPAVFTVAKAASAMKEKSDN